MNIDENDVDKKYFPERHIPVIKLLVKKPPEDDGLDHSNDKPVVLLGLGLRGTQHRLPGIRSPKLFFFFFLHLSILTPQLASHFSYGDLQQLGFQVLGCRLEGFGLGL